MRRTLGRRTTVLVTLGLLALGVAPAHADSRVEVTNDRGTSSADLTYQTRLTIDGRGFQVVRGGFGGVYVLFGWVDDPTGSSWKPSRGGLTGRDYQYIPDAETTADSKGYLRFVAFPGSSTAGEAAAVLSGSGGFRVELTVPGPVFQSVDRDGKVAEVDCRTVTCGVITVGAHGVKNARNETFTPVAFDRVYDAAPAGTTAPTGSPSTAPSAAPSAAPTTSPTAQPTAAASSGTTSGASQAGAGRVGAAGVTVDRTTAVRGHAMTFSARGFSPGEQVVAVLDAEAVALGPMAAGTSGEVAGVLQLPLDLEVGTHELRVTGAASGTTRTERFPVAAGDPTPASTAGASTSTDGSSPSGALVFLAVAVGVFVLAALAFLRTRLRGRSRRTAAPAVTT
ncbi:hypothetical protein [Nocardioides plantarum]|uniref:Htaa protein n=1 Tax=Nocardioides plantarum TaxID=29299 RepID=A0ABV5K756_9ACTN